MFAVGIFSDYFEKLRSLNCKKFLACLSQFFVFVLVYLSCRITGMVYNDI